MQNTTSQEDEQSKRPTERPQACDLNLACEQMQTASGSLCTQATYAALSAADVDRLIAALEDHGHSMLRLAESLRARRLRLKLGR